MARRDVAATVRLRARDTEGRRLAAAREVLSLLRRAQPADDRLEASSERTRELVGEEVFRTSRLYMAAARRGFEDGSLDVAQLLLARPGPSGPAELPLQPWWHS
jgi:cyclopropane fatty-acyl-phospholipid synthase-like methyltransferase